jgi:RES domain-containing protein
VNVDPIGVKSSWWRQIPHGGDPLFVADPSADGRWQRGHVVAAAYFADTEQTAWAEWYRALAEFAIPPDRQMPRDVWRWEVDLEHVANLSDSARLKNAGLTVPHPTRSEWAPFQDVGEQLWAEGFRGVLSPSAGRPAHSVLCLFRTAEEIDGATPVRPALTYRRAPAPPAGMST